MRFADTDAAGIAHFSRMLTWVEAAEHAWFQQSGVPILDLSGSVAGRALVCRLIFRCRFDLKSNSLCVLNACALVVAASNIVLLFGGQFG